MQRSDLFIRLTAVVLFLAVACYIGVYIYDAAANTYQTVTAVSLTVEETASAAGYIVRAETALQERSGAALPVVSEGEKVAAGQVVAVEYKNEWELMSASEIHGLRLKISQLESSSEMDAANSAAKGAESVLELSRAVRRGRFDNLEELSLNVEGFVFAGGDSYDLAALVERLALLESETSGAGSITAPKSGVFSSSADGFEHIHPDMLAGLTPEGLAELFSAGSNTGGYAGKLVTGIRWYYAAVMDYTDAVRVREKERITVQFTGDYRADVLMLVESVSRQESGRCVVVLSSDRGVADISQFRFIESKIIFRTVTGIRVPKEAIHLSDDGATNIYLETGVRAEPVRVEIIGEFGDSYLVKDGAESGTVLHQGAEIIVRANNLSDGKVIGK